MIISKSGISGILYFIIIFNKGENELIVNVFKIVN